MLKIHAQRIRSSQVTGLDHRRLQALERAYDDLRDLILQAYSAVADFTGTFFNYLEMSEESKNTKSAEINNFIAEARSQQAKADRVVANFIAAHKGITGSTKLWPMIESESERLSTCRDEIESLLNTSSFPTGLLKTCIILLPARRVQLYRFLEGDTARATFVPGRTGDIENIAPLGMILNVWRMFLLDFEAIESVLRGRDQIRYTDSAFQHKVYMLRQLYSILPEALDEFKNALTASQIRTPSHAREPPKLPWWRIILNLLGCL